MTDPLFLGFDLSTQQLKAILITANASIVHESAVHFDNDLPHFGTTNGAFHRDDGEVVSPVSMWLEALDLIFERMKAAHVDLRSVVSIGGSAQQHGSVWWGQSASRILSNLDPSRSLAEQLKGSAFSMADAPIWQDSSTTLECEQLQDIVGGAQQLTDITGSRAYERFTGVQIMKVSKRKPDVYSQTSAVSLVSSFLTTLFVCASSVDEIPSGQFPSAIEVSDASGMNLMNVLTHKWDETLLQACGNDLRTKLGSQEPVEGGTIIGVVGSWWTKRWNLHPKCIVSPFTGDNPSTVASLIADPGSALLSLGTSTTFLLSVPPSSSPPDRTTISHLLAHPTSPNSAIIMLCYKNGALAREQIRDSLGGGGSWDTFNEAVLKTSPGCNGNMGLYFPLKEIIPANVQGNFFFDVRDDIKLKEDLPTEIHPRAILESQLLSIKSRILSIMHAEAPPLHRVLISGGSAKNKIFQQVIADIFHLDVYVASEDGSKEAAALGGALLAKWAWWRRENAGSSDPSYLAMRSEDAGNAATQVLVARPQTEYAKLYNDLVDKYRKCEQYVVDHS